MKMKIAIVDFDFNENLSLFPNPFLTKFSSYHKQLGDEVTLENEEIELNFYDKVYAGSLLEASSKTPLELLFNKRVSLVGEIFKGMDNYIGVPNEVARTRPDYLLYDFQYESEFTEASFAQFSNYNHLIITQNWERDKRIKGTIIVMDQNMWSLPSDNIVGILRRLQGKRKIHFLYPVKFSALFNEEVREAFVSLVASPQRKIEFINFTNNHEKIIEVLSFFKGKRMPKMNTPFINITPSNDFDPEIRYKTFLKGVQIVTDARKAGVIIELKIDKPLMEQTLFLSLTRWSLKHNSYLQYITRFTGVSPVESLLNKQYWNNEIISFLRLLREYPGLLNFINIGWQGVRSNMNGLTLDALKEIENDIPIL